MKAIRRLPNCCEQVDDIETAANAAEKAAVSAAKFYQVDLVDLSNARMIRAEKLLESLRQSLDALDTNVEKLHADVQDALTQPVELQAAWNQLPDSWWRLRAQHVDLLLRQFVEVRGQVSNALDVENGDVHVIADSYAALVSNACSAVGAMVRTWLQVIEYFAEWKDLALVMVDGIGESGSLIPS